MDKYLDKKFEFTANQATKQVIDVTQKVALTIWAHRPATSTATGTIGIFASPNGTEWISLTTLIFAGTVLKHDIFPAGYRYLSIDLSGYAGAGILNCTVQGKA